MLTVCSLGEIPDDFGSSAVAIGKFDGMHRGHRAVISRLLQVAQENQLRSVVVTFDRNPLSLLNPQASPPDLASNGQKLALLASTGIDAALILTFDVQLSLMSAADFVQTVLVDALRVKTVLIGHDFRFGSGGEGDSDLLRSYGASLGFEVMLIEDVALTEAGRVSSTAVRQMLAEGRVADAAVQLGAPHSVRGVVVHGAARGRALGYPTANLAPSVEGLVPAAGIYAAWVTVDGTHYPAAVSVGNNPTFDSVPEKQVEAHILDQDFDIYGTTVTVSFVAFVRSMQKFPDADALAKEMAEDVRRVRGILSVAPRISAP
ncbi:MAG: bifunctional riboflavin kinase/FAD synthetase [Rhodoglobus sp.]